MLCVSASGWLTRDCRAFARNSPTCEGPPHLNKRTCRLRPTSSRRKFAGGASTPLDFASTRQVVSERFVQSNWRNATTGESGPTAFGETRQHVEIVLGIICVNQPVPSWILGDFCFAVDHRWDLLLVNHHGTREDYGGCAGWFRICGE